MTMLEKLASTFAITHILKLFISFYENERILCLPDTTKPIFLSGKS